MNIKQRILNISLAVLILATCIFALVGFCQIQKEDEQYHGHELLGSAVAMGFLFLVFVFLITSELSIYSNLRYFLLYKNKTILKTVMNIVILATNMFSFTAFGLYLFSHSNKAPTYDECPDFGKFSGDLFLLSLGLLLGLRLIYFFIYAFTTPESEL